MLRSFGRGYLVRISLRALSALSVGALLLTNVACTRLQKRGEEPVRVSKSTSDQSPASSDQAGNATGAADSGKAALADSGCLAFGVEPGMVPKPPIYIQGKGIVVTRLAKTCTAADGHEGFERVTPWLAMGFPCTAGGGKVDIKGYYTNPKMVSFILGTDCAMNPVGKEQARGLVTAQVPIPAEAPLVAYTPFVLQYWEVVGMPDADVGFSIDLRSAPALDGAWRRIRDNQPMRVQLYGRENAWVQGGHFYFVEADIWLAGRTNFRLDVTNVSALSDEELAKVRERCEALRPSRNCSAVF